MAFNSSGRVWDPNVRGVLGLYWDTGKENGNFYYIGFNIGLYRDNGKENANII